MALHRKQLNDYARLLAGVNEQKVIREAQMLLLNDTIWCIKTRVVQFLRNLDAGDNLTESEKNEVVAKKIGLAMPETYKG